MSARQAVKTMPLARRARPVRGVMEGEEMRGVDVDKYPSADAVRCTM